MTEKNTIYGDMGVDAHKGNVENAFCGKIDTAYPFAWVNIMPDPRLDGFVKTIKVDGDGSKPTQHILDFLETGDETVFEPSADDTHAMPVIDAAAAGFVEEYDFVDVLDVNKLVFPGVKDALITAYSARIRELIDLHRQYGIDEYFFGGETADLPSQVSSYVCNGIVWARTHEKNIIHGNVQPGDTIWGIPSDGQTEWEDGINSGVMCNGITALSTLLMWDGYNQKYPYLRHEKQKYRGRFKVDDRPKILGGLTVSESIRSGTRQWALFLKLLYQGLHAENAFHLLHGVSANTGGGATKVCRLGQNIRYVKEMPEFPPIFQLVMDEGAIPIDEMLADFNCGIGLDIIGSAECGILERVIKSVCDTVWLESYELGSCEASNKPKNEVVITSPYGGMTYARE